MREYVIRQAGVIVCRGVAEEIDFNAGEPEGLEWGAEYSGKPTRKQEIEIALSAIDQKAGMGRLLRETLIAMGGAAVPGILKTHETNAASLRAELAVIK